MFFSIFWMFLSRGFAFIFERIYFAINAIEAFFTNFMLILVYRSQKKERLWK